MLGCQLSLLEKEMVSLTILLPKRSHGFNTGIDRYANELSAFLKKEMI